MRTSTIIYRFLRKHELKIILLISAICGLCFTFSSGNTKIKDMTWLNRTIPSFQSGHIHLMNNDQLEQNLNIVAPEISKEENPNTRKDWSQTYPNKGTDREKRYGVTAAVISFDKKHLNWTGRVRLPKKELAEITRKTFKLMPHVRTTDNNVALVVETAIAESDGGRIISNQFGDHGVFQIKVRTSKDLLSWLKNQHQDIYTAIMNLRNKDLSEKDNLEKNIPYAAAICITEYWRKAGSQYHLHINSIEERGKMWKSVYNTNKGYGTVADFIKRNNNYKTTTTVAFK